MPKRNLNIVIFKKPHTAWTSSFQCFMEIKLPKSSTAFASREHLFSRNPYFSPQMT